MDRMMLYNITYALAAQGGREAALFGNCAAPAKEAFSRSLVSTAFPELWFELPLAGEPWFDLHALVSYEDVAGSEPTFSGQGGAYAEALSWFANQQQGTVRQLALSYDSSSGDVEHPAVQLLVNGSDENVPLEFLEVVGRADAKDAYRAFARTIPHDWYACYVGAFPGRNASGKSPWIRVECIVGDEQQRAYADGIELLCEQLDCIGLHCIDEVAIDAIQVLARTSFPLELQFNVGMEGKVLPVVSASVRFKPEDWQDQERLGEIGRLASWAQAQGLADERWKLLKDVLIAKRVTRKSASAMLTCFPAFVKLRWREGQPMDAKAYLLAEVQ